MMNKRYSYPLLALCALITASLAGYPLKFIPADLCKPKTIEYPARLTGTVGYDSQFVWDKLSQLLPYQEGVWMDLNAKSDSTLPPEVTPLSGGRVRFSIPIKDSSIDPRLPRTIEFFLKNPPYVDRPRPIVRLTVSPEGSSDRFTATGEEYFIGYKLTTSVQQIEPTKAITDIIGRETIFYMRYAKVTLGGSDTVSPPPIEEPEEMVVVSGKKVKKPKEPTETALISGEIVKSSKIDFMYIDFEGPLAKVDPGMPSISTATVEAKYGPDFWVKDPDEGKYLCGSSDCGWVVECEIKESAGDSWKSVDCREVLIAHTTVSCHEIPSWLTIRKECKTVDTKRWGPIREYPCSPPCGKSIIPGMPIAQDENDPEKLVILANVLQTSDTIGKTCMEVRAVSEAVTLKDTISGQTYRVTPDTGVLSIRPISNSAFSVRDDAGNSATLKREPYCLPFECLNGSGSKIDCNTALSVHITNCSTDTAPSCGWCTTYCPFCMDCSMPVVCPSEECPDDLMMCSSDCMATHCVDESSTNPQRNGINTCKTDPLFCTLATESVCTKNCTECSLKRLCPDEICPGGQLLCPSSCKDCDQVCLTDCDDVIRVCTDPTYTMSKNKEPFCNATLTACPTSCTKCIKDQLLCKESICPGAGEMMCAKDCHAKACMEEGTHQGALEYCKNDPHFCEVVAEGHCPENCKVCESGSLLCRHEICKDRPSKVDAYGNTLEPRIMCSHDCLGHNCKVAIEKCMDEFCQAATDECPDKCKICPGEHDRIICEGDCTIDCTDIVESICPGGCPIQ